MSGAAPPLRGLGLPFLGEGGWRWVEDPEAADQAVRAVLLTEPGERLGRPAFGAGLRRFLFRPASLETRTQIRLAIEEAFARDLPRLELEEVDVTPAPGEPERLEIALRFRVPGLAAPRLLTESVHLGGGA